MKDRDGWPLLVGARVTESVQDGFRVDEETGQEVPKYRRVLQGIVARLRPDGYVDVICFDTSNWRTRRQTDLRVMRGLPPTRRHEWEHFREAAIRAGELRTANAQPKT